jgi:xanthine/CO dehydrogenase XdhC/CoxF family maturation factor
LDRSGDGLQDFNRPTLEELQRMACPVGVKIRSQSPQEITVSIMAQFIDKRAELVYEKRGLPASKFELVE